MSDIELALSIYRQASGRNGDLAGVTAVWYEAYRAGQADQLVAERERVAKVIEAEAEKRGGTTAVWDGNEQRALEWAANVVRGGKTDRPYGITAERISQLWAELENDRIGRQLNSIMDLCARARLGWVRVSAVHQLLITDPADEGAEL